MRPATSIIIVSCVGCRDTAVVCCYAGLLCCCCCCCCSRCYCSCCCVRNDLRHCKLVEHNRVRDLVLHSVPWCWVCVARACATRVDKKNRNRPTWLFTMMMWIPLARRSLPQVRSQTGRSLPHTNSTSKSRSATSLWTARTGRYRLGAAVGRHWPAVSWQEGGRLGWFWFVVLLERLAGYQNIGKVEQFGA